MSLIDLIVAIVVVTILVTVVVGLITYVAYKLRLARQPGSSEGGDDGTRYFFLHEPPADEDEDYGDADVSGSASGGSAPGTGGPDRGADRPGGGP